MSRTRIGAATVRSDDDGLDFVRGFQQPDSTNQILLEPLRHLAAAHIAIRAVSAREKLLQ